MKNITTSNFNLKTGGNKLNPKMVSYLKSDVKTFYPLWRVQDASENQAAANYVMTMLMKAFKEQNESIEASLYTKTVRLATAFCGSTKTDEIIQDGLRECEKLALIENDIAKSEIVLLEKCFEVSHVV